MAEVDDFVITRQNGQDVQVETPPVNQETPEIPEPPAEETPEQKPEQPAETPETTEEKPETPEQPAEPAAIDDEEFPDVSELTGGAINTADDIVAMHQENINLKKQLAEKPQIEFPTPQAKALYEYASKFAGSEMSAASTFLHVQGLDMTKLSPQQKQFEAFALENQELTREEARQYFDAIYAKKYPEGSLEDDVVVKFDHERETRKAEQTLRKIQEDFKNLPEPSSAAGQEAPKVSEEDIQAFRQEAEKATQDFAGVKYQMIDNDPNSSVTVAFDAKESKKFQEYLAQPEKLFSDIMEKSKGKNGELDWGKYTLSMYEILNVDRIREQSFNSGVTYGERKKIIETKNISVKQRQETPAPVQKPKTFQESLLEAYDKKR